MLCEVMHDRNVLQLYGLHILYIVRMTSRNDALCPVKHSYCLATCSLLPKMVLKVLISVYTCPANNTCVSDRPEIFC